jgi:hypothetical protein
VGAYEEAGQRRVERGGWPDPGQPPAPVLEIRCPGLRAEFPHLGELLVGRVEAYLQAVDLAQPTAFGRFAQSVVEVDDDGQQSRLLRRVGPQDRAPDAGVLVAAGAAVGACARSQLDFPLREVLFELRPFLVPAGSGRGIRRRVAALDGE